jgi:hypothetical protein
MDDCRRLKKQHIMNVNYQLESASKAFQFDIDQVYKAMRSTGIENSGAVVAKVLTFLIHYLHTWFRYAT